MTLPMFYTPEEIAKQLKVTRRAVYEWVKTGRLRAHRVGNAVRISEGDLLAFIQPLNTSGKAPVSDAEQPNTPPTAGTKKKREKG